jgi:FkbM family methyltransferase
VTGATQASDRPPRTEPDAGERGEFLKSAGAMTPVVAVDADGLRVFLKTADHRTERMLFAKRRLNWRSTIVQAAAEMRRLSSPRQALNTFVAVDARSGISAVTALAHAGFRNAIAIEPDPDNVRLIELNAIENDLAGRLTVINAGIGAKPRVYQLDELSLATAPSLREPWRDGITVPFASLDDILDAHDVAPTDTSIIWRALSGGELRFLAGAEATLGSGVPILLRIATAADAERQELAEALAKYRCRVLDVSPQPTPDLGIAGPDRLADLLRPHAAARRAALVLVLPSRRVAGTPVGTVSDDAGRIMRRRLSHPVPVDQPVILITQPPRSGGTLLMRLFDGHPQCHTFPWEMRVDWEEIREAGRWEYIMDRARQQSFLAIGFKQTKSRLNQETSSFPVLTSPALDRRLFHELIKSSSDRDPRDIANAFFTAQLNAWLDNQNLYGSDKRWITTFHPRAVFREEHDRAVEAFADTYPDGVIISIVREPKSWYASSSRWSAGYRDIEPAINVWTRATEHLDALESRLGERLVVLSFADLVTRTEDVMRQLVARLGIRFVPELTVPTFNRFPIRANSSFPTTDAAVSSDAATRHREVLTPDQAAEIDEMVGDLYTGTIDRFVRPLASDAS